MKEISHLTKNIYKLIPVLLFAIIFASCEEEFIPEVIENSEQIVVEGYIEAGENATAPYVLLTKSVSFFSEISTDQYNNLFVHDAEVIVSDGEKEVVLEEFCLSNLSPEQREQAAELFGLNADSLEVDFCVYLDLTFSMMGEEGKTYDLKIEVDGQQLSASTTIPYHVPLDSLNFRELPGEPNDTLKELRVAITDPANQKDYYRYFTGTNERGLSSAFNSIIDDGFFDGLAFEFPLPESEAPTEEFNLDTYGYYNVGDEVEIKWCTVDENHFDFWNTLEFNRQNQGPFSSYTRIATNIEGGIGIWGGYSVSFYNLLVE